jgi:hypothetical protein
MADLSIQTVSIDGLNPAFAAAASGGDAFVNDGKSYVHAKNGHSSAQTVRVVSQVNPAPPGTAAANKDISIPAGQERQIGPFPKSAYNDANGKVQLQYPAGVTALTVAAVSCPNASACSPAVEPSALCPPPPT